MCLSNPTVSSTAAAVHTILRTISFAGQGGYSKSLSDAGCSDENLQVTLLAARLGSGEATYEQCFTGCAPTEYVLVRAGMRDPTTSILVYIQLVLVSPLLTPRLPSLTPSPAPLMVEGAES